MSLWWLQEDWNQALCAQCGRQIWPEGDPDWGLCYECFSSAVAYDQPERPEPLCDVCHQYPAVAGVGNVGVCSEECHYKAEAVSDGS